MQHRILILLVLSWFSCQAVAAPSLAFQHYDKKNSQLYMRLVTPSTKGDVLLRVGEQVQPLPGAQLEGLFSLRVPLSCEWLATGATLYWATTNNPVVSAPVPEQDCHGDFDVEEIIPLIPPVRIVTKPGECWVEVGENTLWRAAAELSKLNNATVYQNVYGLFLTNREAFAGEDINRLKAPVLRCPPDQILADIPAADARRLFSEMLTFKATH